MQLSQTQYEFISTGLRKNNLERGSGAGGAGWWSGVVERGRTPKKLFNALLINEVGLAI